MKLVIKPHRPRQRLLVAVGLLLLAGVGVGAAFHYGQWHSIVGSMGRFDDKRGIVEDYVALKQTNADLVRDNAKLTRNVEIDTHARADYRDTVSNLQSEIADLKLELAFYRDILSSTEADKGPHVRGFRLRNFGGDGRYQYRLVLTHVNKDDKVAAGRVAVDILGRKSGSKRSISLAEVAEPESGDMTFEFKHFRRIEGVLQLPESFAPEQVRVAVYENGRKKSTFNETYAWAKIIN